MDARASWQTIYQTHGYRCGTCIHCMYALYTAHQQEETQGHDYDVTMVGSIDQWVLKAVRAQALLLESDCP